MSLIASMGLSPSGASLQATASPDGGEAGAHLADFLSGDVQGNAVAAHEIVRRIDEVASGVLPSWERVGNAYTLSVEPDGAWLIFHYGEEGGTDTSLPLEELRGVMRRWAEEIRKIS